MDAMNIIYGLAAIILGWGFVVIQKLSKSVAELTAMIAGVKQKNADDEKTCAVKHEAISRTLQRHEETLKDHEKRISKTEK